MVQFSALRSLLKMIYYNSIKDKNGYIHSIDMLYYESFSQLSPNGVLDTVRAIHEKYPNLDYLEMLDRKPCSKYDYYIHGISISGVYVSTGRYTDYETPTKVKDTCYG